MFDLVILTWSIGDHEDLRKNYIISRNIKIHNEFLISFYLTIESKYVQWDHTSFTLTTIFGVPQDSDFGPLFFPVKGNLITILARN